MTLRHERAYEFLDRLMSIAIPRIRDFRGLNPRSFDGRGNYSMGVREQIIFPEIDYDSIDQVRGLDMTITTSARTDEEAFALLEAFGMPFSEEGRPGRPPPTPRPEAEDERRRGRPARGPRPSRPPSSSSRRRTRRHTRSPPSPRGRRDGRDGREPTMAKTSQRSASRAPQVQDP